MTGRIKKLFISALSSALLGLFCAGSSALAAVDASTALDKSSYVSADEFENTPIGLKTVMVGLDYGRSAVDSAGFSSGSRQGFYIGHHDSDRAFSPFMQTDADDISVSFEPAEKGSWRALLKKEYSSRLRALIVAGINGGYAEKQGDCWRVYCGAYDTKSQCNEALEKSGLSGAPYCAGAFCISIVDNRDGAVIYQLEYGERSISLAPLGGDGELTEHTEDKYHGSFKIDADTNGLTVINYVDLETYVKGVIPYEMSSSWPLEALKAQAICARTYAVYNEDGYDHYGFDVTDDTYSQVYRGVLRANETTDLAVESTAGLTVRYEGDVCRIYYSASDGGATEDGINVFDVDLPYLKGVYDPFEDSVDYDIKDWHFEYTGQEICQRLLDDDYEIGVITEIVPTLSDTENVIAMTFSDADGTSVTINGRWCYNILGLHNCRFTVSKDGDKFVFNGDGWGHNCGMSQYGAKAMASVYGYNCEDIIRFYFSGAYVA